MKKCFFPVFFMYNLCLVFALNGCNSCLFFYKGVTRYKDTAALFSSARVIAEKITKFVKDRVEKRKKGEGSGDAITVLEAGAGVGPYTEVLVEILEKDDLLYVVEFDPDLCEVLRKKFDKHENVKIIEGSILDCDFDDDSFDFIISSLPMNTQGIKFVKSVLDMFSKKIKNGGIVSYVEVFLGHTLKQLFCNCGDKSYPKIHGLIEEFKKKFAFKKEWAYMKLYPFSINWWPYWIHHLKID